MIIFFIVLFLPVFHTHSALDRRIRDRLQTTSTASATDNTIERRKNKRKSKFIKQDALHNLARQNNSKGLMEILKKENPNKTNSLGRTALHIAVYYKNIEATNILCDNSRTNINIQDIYGDTPLHLASSKIIAQLLVDKDANTSIKNRTHYTALNKAIQSGRMHIATIINPNYIINPTIEQRETIRKKIQEQEKKEPARSLKNSCEQTKKICQICYEQQEQLFPFIKKYSCKYLLCHNCYDTFKEKNTTTKPYWQCPTCQSGFANTVSKKEKAEAQTMKNFYENSNI